MDEREEKKVSDDELNNQNSDLNEERDKLDKDGVTREINLDELYDGAVNNTVVIDPITNDEILLPPKKTNYTLLGVILAISVLLILYYVSNKTEIGGTTKDVTPKTTTLSINKTEPIENGNGTLTCNYSSKSDAETQTVTFIANYENNNLTNSNFNYVVVSNLGSTSAVIEDLKNQYENFYINNVAVAGNNVSYEKNDNGFTFNAETNYQTDGFDNVVITEGQTILYVMPSKTDTYDSLRKAYEDKGFSCVISTKLGD